MATTEWWTRAERPGDIDGDCEEEGCGTEPPVHPLDRYRAAPSDRTPGPSESGLSSLIGPKNIYLIQLLALRALTLCMQVIETGRQAKAKCFRDL
ncbi:hypothetical protein CRG98_006011 [Punica granatum]|uniref:Uncharacterized protein n=1 Tax=Punica granatum TaxID=22663 RepID=A0A2I0KYT4_PUNGR|nr:hypothetical protein CRG98_006011 [Punica granatum]